MLTSFIKLLVVVLLFLTHSKFGGMLSSPFIVSVILLTFLDAYHAETSLSGSLSATEHLTKLGRGLFSVTVLPFYLIVLISSLWVLPAASIKASTAGGGGCSMSSGLCGAESDGSSSGSGCACKSKSTKELPAQYKPSRPPVSSVPRGPVPLKRNLAPGDSPSGQSRPGGNPGPVRPLQSNGQGTPPATLPAPVKNSSSPVAPAK